MLWIVFKAAIRGAGTVLNAAWQLAEVSPE